MRLLLPTLLVLSACLPPPARAAQSYANCTGFVASLPAVISTQGTWCMDKDLSTAIASGAAISINANNVTLDCNHFKLGGLAAGAGTQAKGVRVEGRLNFTLRNCAVRGFQVGVQTKDGGGHVVRDSRFDGNTFAGIDITSDASLVQENQVLDTGGSTVSTLETVGIRIDGPDNHVLDNIITGVAPLASNGYAFGILMLSPASGTIGRNAISGLLSGTSANYGIYGTGFTIVHGNTVQGVAGSTGGYGILCGSSKVAVRDSTVVRFQDGVSGCANTSGNLVVPN